MPVFNPPPASTGGVSDGDKGDITVSASGATWTIDPAAVLNSQLADMATKTYKGRTSALTGVPENVAVATVKTDLALVKADVGLGSVDNTADSAKPVSTTQQTALDLKANLAGPTFTGTVTLPNATVTLAMMANMATASLIYRKTAGAGVPEVNTLATFKTDLVLVKADVGLSSVENTALSTWAGSANVTSLGTIATGIWNGTVIIGTYGGTGVNNSTKTFTYLKNISLTAADDTGVYTLPTGTKTLLATDGSIAALTGTIASAVLGNSSLFVGTTSIALNRATSSMALTGITSIDGSAATLTNPRTIGGVSFNGSAAITVATATGGFTVTGGATTLAAGTTTVSPLTYLSGTNLTNAAIGANEFDGVQYYETIDTSSGRGAIPVEQYFHLTANGGTIGTIANFFGATSNISLVASAYYVIDIYCWFLNTTAGTVTWTFTNSAAPTSQNVIADMSPIAGIGVDDAWSATGTPVQFATAKDVTAGSAVTTGTLATAVNHFAHFKIFLQNGTGTSLKIQATKNVGGTITPLLNSYWFARRLSPNNIGTFAA